MRNRSPEQRARYNATRSEMFANNPDIREKANAGVRKWRAENPERVKESNRRWREENPEKASEIDRRKRKAKPDFYASLKALDQAKRRAIMYGAFIEHVDRLVVLERADGVCGICYKDVDPLNYHADHIIPLARGGEHSYANHQPAHPRCNLRKNKKLQEELTFLNEVI